MIEAMISPLNGRRTAVLYVRVSSKDQEKEGFSIPAQRKLLCEYATSNGLHIIREFEDVETAKRAGRLGFTEMVSFLRRNSTCGILLVEKTDRLYRNMHDYVVLDELDLAIHLVKEGVIISDKIPSSQKFVHGIKVLMAKNYVDNLSEETRKGMLEKARQGIWPSCAPLGYQNVFGRDGKRVIEPDPDVAPKITWLFERYATGGHSLLELTRLARENGLCFRKSADSIPKSTIHKILRNRIYIGDFDWDGKTYGGVHKPLVSIELWQTAQDIMDGRFGARRRKVKHEFAFSGLMQCGHCGCALVGELKKGRYVYYHCTGHKGKCAEPYTREEILEERFTSLLDQISFDDDVLAWVVKELRNGRRDERRASENAIAKLNAEYARLQSRIDTMYIDKLDGRIDIAYFDRKAAEWRAEQARLAQAIQNHPTGSQGNIEDGIRILELAHQAPRLFEKQPPLEKRRLLNFVVSNCTWKDGEMTAQFRQPFDLLAITNKAAASANSGGNGSTGRFENWLPIGDSNHN